MVREKQSLVQREEEEEKREEGEKEGEEGGEEGGGGKRRREEAAPLCKCRYLFPFPGQLLYLGPLFQFAVCP